MRIRLGTRKSPLARAQAGTLARRLEAAGHQVEEVLVTSAGDVDRTRPLHQMEVPGAFTRALEEALEAGRIDIAVHSMKDLPLGQPEGLPVVAVPARGDPRDVLLVRADAIDPSRPPLGLVAGARVATSSPRRQSQVAWHDGEATLVDVRGNVDTRLRLLAEGYFDALLMAKAALERLGLAVPPGVQALALPIESFPTCPSQGFLAIQARAGSSAARAASALDDPEARAASALERTVLGALGGGCGMPLGATAAKDPSGRWRLVASLAPESWLEEGPRLAWVRLEGREPAALAEEAVRSLAAPPTVLAPAASARVLAGVRVLLTFDAASAGPYLAALRALGAEAEPWLLVEHVGLAGEPTARVRSAWRAACWVLVASPRAVEAVARLKASEPPTSARFGATGPATARALRRVGLPVHLVAKDGTGASLAKDAARWSKPGDGPVLVPGAAEPYPEMRAALRAAGYQLVHWPTYATRRATVPESAPLELPADVLVVASPSAAAAVPPQAARRIVAFGPSTAKALEERGVRVNAICRRRTPAAVIEAILAR